MFAGLGGMGGAGGGAPDVGAMLQMLQQPGVQQAMQGILSNPQMLQSMMNSNPQMRAMMEQNPQVRSVTLHAGTGSSNANCILVWLT